MSVIVFIESSEGKLKKNAFETLTYAFKTSQANQSACIAVTLGKCENEIDLIAKFGVQKLICIENKIEDCDNSSISSALAKVYQQENGKTIVLSNSNFGKSIGPRLAVKCNASFISNVIDIPSSSKVKKKSFSGKAFEYVESLSENIVFAISPNSFYVEENLKNLMEL